MTRVPSGSHDHHASRSRIPTALQAVFLTSNRGGNVETPPPDRAAHKVFQRNWFYQPKSNSQKALSKKLSIGDESVGESENVQSLEVRIGKLPDAGSSSLKLSTSYISLCQHVSSVQSLRLVSRSAVPPQVYLDAMLRSRGYSTKRYNTLHSGYYNRPTPLQQASYDVYLIQLIRRNQVAEFSQTISCGISPNPCNAYGESIVHMVCRRGNLPLLTAMLTAGCDVQVADDHGRTPLHDACWAPEPAWSLVHTILRIDPRLLHMIDARGNVPLDYVRKDHWAQWIEYLESLQDTLWPLDKDAAQKLAPPPLTLQPSDSRPVPDPKNALNLELAAMVASGSMKPAEAVRINLEEQTEITEEISDSDDEDDDDDCSSTYSDDDDYDSDASSSDDFDEDDLEDLLYSLPIVKRY